MKKIIFLITLLFSIVSQVNAQTTFGLKIEEISNDGSNYIISLKMQMFGDDSSVFQLGSSSLQFTFPNNAISNPVLESTTLESPLPYFTPTVTVPLIDQCSFNIELAIPDLGMDIAAAPAWTELGRINFTIDNINQLVPLTWSYNGGTTQTVIYLDDEIVQIFAENPSEDHLIFEPLTPSVNPVFTYIPADAMYECGVEIPIDTATAIVSDANCGQVSIGYDDEIVAEDCQTIITRTYTATDDCQNTSTAIQVITLVDTEAPEFLSTPDSLTFQCLSEVTDPETPNFVDQCDSSPTLTFTEESNGNCPTLITRTWEATDACGNSSSIQQLITVQDDQAPVVTSFPQDVNITCDNEIPEIEAPIFTDNCDNELDIVFTEETDGACPLDMTITRTWTATDDCGNNAMQTQTINVSSTSSISSLEKYNFNVSLAPNPTADFITLTCNTFYTEDIQINILNLLGELIYQSNEKTEIGRNIYSLSFSSYQSGIYFVQVKSNQGNKTLRVIKE